jgi:hypothetical protein
MDCRMCVRSVRVSAWHVRAACTPARQIERARIAIQLCILQAESRGCACAQGTQRGIQGTQRHPTPPPLPLADVRTLRAHSGAFRAHSAPPPHPSLSRMCVRSETYLDGSMWRIRRGGWMGGGGGGGGAWTSWRWGWEGDGREARGEAAGDRNAERSNVELSNPSRGSTILETILETTNNHKRR